MATLYGQQLTKQDLLRRVGSVETLAGIRLMEHGAGRAKGMGLYDVVNGDLRFSLNIDKCLDLGSLYYRGVPLFFLARGGEMAPLWYSDGPNAPRSITGGMFFTCGFNNVGPLQTLENGRTLPQHGYSRTSPARMHGASAAWDGDEYTLTVTGEMREASLFGENIVLRRTVTTRLGEASIHIHDVIENENVHPAPLMLMYHCNVGYPLLDRNAYALFDAQSTRCRDEVAREGLAQEDCRVFGAPVDHYAEQVFYHRLAADGHRCQATLVNPDLKLALRVAFDNRELPNLIQWKCKASGDYVMGLEPSNCYPEGLQAQRDSGELRTLAPGEQVHTDLTLSVLADEAFAQLPGRQGA